MHLSVIAPSEIVVFDSNHIEITGITGFSEAWVVEIKQQAQAFQLSTKNCFKHFIAQELCTKSVKTHKT